MKVKVLTQAVRLIKAVERQNKYLTAEMICDTRGDEYHIKIYYKTTHIISVVWYDNICWDLAGIQVKLCRKFDRLTHTGEIQAIMNKIAIAIEYQESKQNGHQNFFR